MKNLASALPNHREFAPIKRQHQHNLPAPTNTPIARQSRWPRHLDIGKFDIVVSAAHFIPLVSPFTSKQSSAPCRYRSRNAGLADEHRVFPRNPGRKPSSSPPSPRGHSIPLHIQGGNSIYISSHPSCANRTPPATLSPPTQASDSPTLTLTNPFTSHEYHHLDQPSQALAQRQQQHNLYSSRLLYSTQASSSSGLLSTPSPVPPRPEPVASGIPRSRIRGVSFTEPRRQEQAAPRASSVHHASRRSESSRPAHQVGRISSRTASAILHTLEESIRSPYPFTPDLEEENASMADLNPRAPAISSSRNTQAPTSNGGPLPTSAVVTAAALRGPREVWRDRQIRDARKKAEEEEDTGPPAREDPGPQKPSSQPEQTRRNVVGQISAAVAGGAAAAVSNPEVNPSRQENTRAPRNPPGLPVPSAATRQIQARPDGAPPAQPRTRSPSSKLSPESSTLPNIPGETRSAPVDIPATRSRILQEQTQPPAPQAQRLPDPFRTPPRATQAPQNIPTAASSRVSQPQGYSTQALPSTQPPLVHPIYEPAQSRAATTSSFPHAFERWETLSAHWEGLTSYWIRRLEENVHEVRRDPLAQQMSRQITDLSAAGANLFHAVVELQRLRASSERKFQRWFFETRQEQETAQEVLANLEGQLRRERMGREDMLASVARMEKDKSNAEKLVAEMRRELLISKDEARRAWEELGRREQEERERTTSLRDGQPTLVGGVQVVPMMPGVSRNQSINRPSTREEPFPDPQLGGGNLASQVISEPPNQAALDQANYAQYLQSSLAAEEAYRQSARLQTSEPQYGLTTSSAASISYPTTTNGVAIASAPGLPRAAHIPPIQPYTSTTQAPAVSESMGSPASRVQYPSIPAAHPGSSPFYQHEGHSLQSPAEARGREEDNRSIIPSEAETFSDNDDYAPEEPGNWRLDASGRPIPVRRALPSEDSDEYDVSEDAARERAHRARYSEQGSHAPSTLPPQAPGLPSQGYSGAYSAQDDYRYGGVGPGWEAVPRHTHPTRLSVVEEDDERSRTSASRQSDRNGRR
ncbi:MAG: hypothetical protein M1829_003885 [Trizodia sp. TS-e1964]|nr:MAG: hypothetical protein M1829_003885 [Trizodia sp. TS-e1964]